MSPEEPVMWTRRPRPMQPPRNRKASRCSKIGLGNFARVRIARCPLRQASSMPLPGGEGCWSFVMPLPTPNRRSSSTWTERGSCTGCYPGVRIWPQKRSRELPGARKGWPEDRMHCTSARTQAISKWCLWPSEGSLTSEICLMSTIRVMRTSSTNFRYKSRSPCIPKTVPASNTWINNDGSLGEASRDGSPSCPCEERGRFPRGFAERQGLCESRKA